MTPSINLEDLHNAIAAVCPIVGVSADGTIFYDPLNVATATQQAAAASVLASWNSHPLAQQASYTWQQFKAMFTAAENAAIFRAALGNPMLLEWMMDATAAQSLSLLDPRLKAGLDALVTAGLITDARQTQILAGTLPT